MLDWLRGGMRRLPASAEEWAVRMQGGSLTRREQLAFDAWLTTSPAHAQDYASCNKVGHLASQLKFHPDLLQGIPTAGGLHSKKRRRSGATWGRLALTAAGCIVLALLLLPRLHSGAPVEVIMTAHGEQRQMPLQDGTRLHVNTETRLILDFSGSERRAILDKGEAFFEVARDARRPFVVVVGNSEVQVLGTKFNVRKNEHGVSVVVSEGRVAVQPNRKLAATTMPQSLIAGQKLLLDEVSHQMTISTIDAEMATAWRSGQLYFDAAPLEQVVMDVNRYSRKQFVIEGPALKGMRLSGNFRAGDIESVQFALRDAFAIQSQEQGDKIVLRAAQAKTPG